MKLLSRATFVALFFAALGLTAAAQTTKAPPVEKGVFWFDKDSAVEVYLFPGAGRKYRLTVVSDRDVKVTYHTSINSFEPVDKELEPAATLGAVKYFEFAHNFSRTTIWMSLEFTVDGKKVPGLTRTFYDGIFETIENPKSYDVKKKKPN
ncbi:MAG: hypothetical protein JSS81_00495 [Acidobacteria bacterium]|nr:hypothetical protein [Acidobacteriota bacterium]